jgi:two-component system, chemotaxis family, response regulator Rcp1
MSLRLKPVEVLVVEDNPGDAMIIREVLCGNKMYCQLSEVKDGEEALNFLYRKEVFIDAPRPDLILLDLNLPKKDGREVLAEIKTDEKLKQIPVIVMTTSQAEDDILKSYSLHANCFISKPMDLEDFITTVKLIETFWFSTVKLPSGK